MAVDSEEAPALIEKSTTDISTSSSAKFKVRIYLDFTISDLSSSKFLSEEETQRIIGNSSLSGE